MKVKRKRKKPQKYLMFDLVSVRVVSSIFTAILFIGFVAVRNVLLGKEILYYNISQNVPLSIIYPNVLEK